MNPPADDELEVSLFGPGFGECVMVHLGSGHWVVIDSCIDASNGIPAPLYYFHQMGVDPDAAVVCVMVTHWHDDHIRGVSKVLMSCQSARVCVPQAMRVTDFVRGIVGRDATFNGHVTSGVREIRRVFESEQMARNPILATENTIVWAGPAATFAHGQPVELRALSPSGLQGLASMQRIAAQLQSPTNGRLRRLPRSGSNDLAIASWVSIGSQSLLLGADLEIHNNPACGWGAVLALHPQLPGPRADVFKVPHHGSVTGHDDHVWSQMLSADPVAILTPWTHGSGLPTAADLDRIRGLTTNGYATNLGRVARPGRMDPAVEKTLRENGITLRSCEGVMGHIRLRKKLGANWVVDRFGAAERLGG